MQQIRKAPSPQSRTDGDEKRERILAVAESLFHRQGYADTTMDQIVQALGVTKPFVYYRFRSKQEIFETLTWRAAVPSFTAFDYPEDDSRPAHRKLAEGIERLIRATIEYYPSAFFAYRDPQAYRPEFSAELNRLAEHMYSRMCALMDAARDEGKIDFRHTRVTAMAACSIPGFLYTWYRPDGPLSPEEMVEELTQLTWRLLGIRRR